MKNVRSLLFLAAGVVILGGVAGVIIAKHHAGRDAALQEVKVAEAALAKARAEARSAAAPVEAPVAPATAGVEAPPEASVSLESTKPVEATSQTNSSAQKLAVQANQGGPPGKEPWRDPVARAALAFVGMDADADAFLEAYKDLWNLANLAMGGGQPVR